MRHRRSLGAMLLALATALAIPAQTSAAPVTATSKAATVNYDQYSVKLNGRRIMIQAAEFHYFRLPSPDLWRDVLEKEKAAGLAS